MYDKVTLIFRESWTKHFKSIIFEVTLQKFHIFIMCIFTHIFLSLSMKQIIATYCHMVGKMSKPKPGTVRIQFRSSEFQVSYPATYTLSALLVNNSTTQHYS